MDAARLDARELLEVVLAIAAVKQYGWPAAYETARAMRAKKPDRREGGTRYRVALSP